MTSLPTLGEFQPIGDPAPPVPADVQPRPEDVRRIAELEQQVRDLRAEATPPVEKEKPGFDGWSLRIALAATIGLTASGEFALAQLMRLGSGAGVAAASRDRRVRGAGVPPSP